MNSKLLVLQVERGEADSPAEENIHKSTKLMKRFIEKTNSHAYHVIFLIFRYQLLQPSWREQPDLCVRGACGVCVLVAKTLAENF